MRNAIRSCRTTTRWPAEFGRIGTALRAALGGLALRIDHIGSTAVPGLAAKDVIDVQVTVAALDAEAIAAALAPLGYALRAGVTRTTTSRRGGTSRPRRLAEALLPGAPSGSAAHPPSASARRAGPTSATPCCGATTCARRRTTAAAYARVKDGARPPPSRRTVDCLLRREGPGLRRHRRRGGALGRRDRLRPRKRTHPTPPVIQRRQLSSRIPSCIFQQGGPFPEPPFPVFPLDIAV